MSTRPFRSQLTPLNPKPSNNTVMDERPLPESGGQVARQGYQTISRSDPSSFYRRNPVDLAPPVYDGPNVDYEQN